MDRKTFKTFQENKDKPMVHCEMIIQACDSDGEKFTVRFNELSNDYAHTEYTNCIRGMLRSGYQEVK